MSVQQFCLRWNNHQPNFISVFSTLLHNESLVDVTLAAEGRHLQAHKVVLSACSSYFQTLFTVNPCQHPIVILKDVKYMDLKTMVDFMYYGEVNVSQEQLPHILKTAEMLKIKGLAEMPDSTSLTKSHSASSERADLLTPGESTWGSDTHRHSPSPAPLSPNSRRKRLRKSSTGSTSISTERGNSEEHVLVHSSAGEPPGGSGLIRTIKHNTSSESDNQQGVDGSQEIHDEDNHRLMTQKSTESDSGGISVVQTLGAPMVDMGGPSMSGNCSQQQPGLQWTLVEHGYPRFALSQCQTSLDNNTSTMQQYTQPYQPSQVISVNSCGVSTENNYHGTPMSNSTSPSESIPVSMPQYPTVTENATINNQTVKVKRTKNPQADENFVRALEAVRFGGIGFCKAARMYGVNNRTLWLEFKKRGYPNNRPSIKNRVKLETPSPPPPINMSQQQPLELGSNPGSNSDLCPNSELGPNSNPPPEDSYPGGSNSGDSPVMCPPPPSHAHQMNPGVGMMGFLDTRHHVEFSPAVSRPRFQEPLGMNQAPINLHGVAYSNM